PARQNRAINLPSTSMVELSPSGRSAARQTSRNSGINTPFSPGFKTATLSSWHCMSEPSLEVEMKFAGVDFALLEGHLKEHCARLLGVRQEADHYFNAPDRDFAITDEALRLRRVGLANFVTYKGPKRDRLTKTRTEIEVPLAEGDRAAGDFVNLLKLLGYRPV